LTNRLQILRSSTPGQVPAAGVRLAGEMWTNFPDLQLGVIDTTKTAQKLLAVRFFATTANYATGDAVVRSGEIYIAKSAITAGAFNPAQWNQIAWLSDIPALYVLPTASTTVLGGVKIDGTTITIASGVISSAGLVTVSSTAPSPVQNGALWYDLVGGQLYAWVNDGTSSQWVVAVNQSISGVYLPMTGGTLTGPLTLAADPVNPLDAATKQYAEKPFGVTNGSDAAAGIVGEVVQTLITTLVNLPANTATNVGSIALTPGDWDVCGELWLQMPAAAAGTQIYAGLTPTSAVMPTAPALATGRNVQTGTFPISSQAYALPVGPVRASIASTTTYYLVGQINASSGVGGGTGKIWARRRR